MSYKKFNDLQNLYEGVVSESNEIDEYTELVYNVIIAEMVYKGHSESVIRTYVENISEEQILEKVESFISLEEYDLNEEQTDLLFSLYQEQEVLDEKVNIGGLIKNVKNLKNLKLLKNINRSGDKLRSMIGGLFKGKGKSGQFLDGSKTGIDLNKLKGAKDGPGLLQKLKNLKTSTGDKLNKFKSKFDRKVTKTSKTVLGKDGKPLKTTKIVNPINKTNALIGGAGLIGGVTALTSGGDKNKDNSSDNLTDKDKNDINKENQLNNVLNNKDKLQQLETKPKKKNAAGVEMTGSGTKDDPWISKAVKVKDVHIPMTDPRNPHYYKGIEKGLPNKADWLKKTANSPAAKAFGNSDEANERRWQTRLKHREWQDKNNRGAFKVKKEKPKSDTYTTNIGAFLNNKKKGDVKDKSRHTKVTSVMDMESYDAKGEVLGESVVKTVGSKVGKVVKAAKGVDVIRKTAGEVVKNATKKSKEGEDLKMAPNPSAKAPQSAPSAPSRPDKAPNAPSRPKPSTGPKGGESQRNKPKAKPKASTPPQDAPKQSAPTRQESYDAYDLVLNYIMETEQASSIEEANYIMIEMDQNTIHEIVEEQKKTLIEWKGKLATGAVLAMPWALSELEKRWNPVKKARDKYQDKKATEYEKKSGTTKKDGYFR